MFQEPDKLWFLTLDIAALRRSISKVQIYKEQNLFLAIQRNRCLLTHKCLRGHDCMAYQEKLKNDGRDQKMKFDMKAWTDSVQLLLNNRELVIVVAGIFLFLPSLALNILAPSTAIEMAAANKDAVAEEVVLYFEENWLLFLAYVASTTVGSLSLLALLGRKEKITVGEAISVGAKATIPYLIASFMVVIALAIVATLIGLLATGLGTVFGLVAGLAFFIGLIFLFRLILVGPVMAIEGIRNPISAIVRSWVIVKGNTNDVAAFIVLLVVALIVLSLVFGLVVSVIGALLPRIDFFVGIFFSTRYSAVVSTVGTAVYASIHCQLTE